MPQSLDDLEQQRSAILDRMTELGDFRPGSITTTSGRCGKANCRCHRPDEPPHGPTERLTYKIDGKTVSESPSESRGDRPGRARGGGISQVSATQPAVRGGQYADLSTAASG